MFVFQSTSRHRKGHGVEPAVISNFCDQTCHKKAARRIFLSSSDRKRESRKSLLGRSEIGEAWNKAKKKETDSSAT